MVESDDGMRGMAPANRGEALTLPVPVRYPAAG
jgi:hypothetical protein